MFRGRGPWSLTPGTVVNLSVVGPFVGSVSMEGVGPRLHSPQCSPITDVHLLGGHLLTARPLKARTTHAGMRAAAGPAVLAGGLAVGFDAAIGSWSHSPARAALLTSTHVGPNEPPRGSLLLGALPAAHPASLLLLWRRGLARCLSDTPR